MKTERTRRYTRSLLTFYAGLQAASTYVDRTKSKVASKAEQARFGPLQSDIDAIRKATDKQERKAAKRLKDLAAQEQAKNAKRNCA